MAGPICWPLCRFTSHRTLGKHPHSHTQTHTHTSVPWRMVLRNTPRQWIDKFMCVLLGAVQQLVLLYLPLTLIISMHCGVNQKSHWFHWLSLSCSFAQSDVTQACWVQGRARCQIFHCLFLRSLMVCGQPSVSWCVRLDSEASWMVWLGVTAL